MRATTFESNNPEDILPWVHRVAAAYVLHFIPDFMQHFSLSYGCNQFWSIRCRCISTATQKLHRGMWTKAYAYNILVNADSWARFEGHRSAGLLSWPFFWIGSFCLELFLYFLFLFSNRGISDPLQKEKKATRCPNTFCESDFQQGGPCCLHTGYRNWRFYGLLGSSDDCILCRWKTNYKSKRLSTHVAPNPSSVQLSHELSDLLC